MDEPTIIRGPERPASRRIPWPIAAASACAALLLLILWFGHELSEGDGASIDRAIMLAMRVPGHPDIPAGPAWLPSAMRDVTALGSATVLTFVVASAAIFLALHQRMRSMALVLGATLLGSAVVTVIKALVSRARPDLIDRLMVEVSHSFPSGHAANSAIVYLTLATLLFPVMPDRRLRGFVLGVAILLTGAIGVSRVYLGVHWPSDVVAGWVFGGGWAMLWWWIELRWLDGKKPVAM
ncbi:MAG: phosphatase PAP2 family protein [Sphingomonas sp.]|uniref:phosphatase PAP2 family protein n=1 Tax=Sphingomonas sp. TaxID=28214 RepID=UPI0025EF88C4|nr:phosphatase PAP2 family protein [Sphingomonas sp.]MBX3563264.1 phosphatase PAP2 family protein [Sphingomonas sp.]